MSGESAADTLWTVGQKRVLANLEKPTLEKVAQVENKFKKTILDQYELESSPYFATARLWDDGILDPVKTRVALALAFSVTANALFPTDRFGTFRM
jgi:acetyl-CoA carboxylase carboxyltransferase component